MMKTRLILLLLFCVTGPLQASLRTLWLDDCWRLWLPKDGKFVLGAKGGIGERLGNVDITLVYTSPLADIPTSFIIEDYTDIGYTSGIFAGYQFRCARFLLGAEFSIDWDNLDDNHYFAFSDANAQTGLPGFAYNAMARYEQGTSYGLSVRIGYVMSHCFIPYFRFGLERSVDTLTVAFAGDPAIYNLSIITGGKSTQNRYVVGIGTEVPLPMLPCITARLEYDFHSRGKVAEGLGLMDDGIGFNPFFMSKIHPKTSIVSLALAWNFSL